MKFFIAPLWIVAILLLSCNAPKTAVSSLEPYEIRVLDTMVVTARAKKTDASGLPLETLPPYRASATRTFDLLHTRLDLSFDWEREAVIGMARLNLLPYFLPVSELVLDAKGFEIQSVVVAGSEELPAFAYDGEFLRIPLGKTYSRLDTVQVEIRYTAFPASSGGSWAITSDKGLFFINPKGENSNKPMQIWTQGETENNSRWFPTIDKPNERCTGEIILTVENRFKTLSNGILVSSIVNGDGSRTDHWKMDQPHAPYLFMIAVGDYAVVKDQWRETPLEYYVEPKYEPHAKAIFPHTPEMLEFFSKLLDYPYPWPKYSQIVVRDFVSGAMENTTAVVFGEFVNGTSRELVDALENDRIVAHEMIHHWFGNLVTCESWANLTLNEGFANYGEYLWFEHKYGKEQADYHLESELTEYLFSTRSGGVRPLIHFEYADREDMFDHHSYNKGGMTLHMLRNYLGDEAFFAGLNLYLTRHAFTAVESHELRLAMEEISGEDLNWFFNQWFFQEGHPILDIQYDYDALKGEVKVKATQMQYDEGFSPIFQFPATIQIFLADGKVIEENSWMRERVKEFSFPVYERPQLVLFDPDRTLLAVRKENKSNDDYARQYYLAFNVRDRLEALQKLAGSGEYPMSSILKDALGDSFWAVRLFALNNLDISEDLLPVIAKMASDDPHSYVRGASCAIIGEFGGPAYIPLLSKISEEDYSIEVVVSALGSLYMLSPEDARLKAESLEPSAEGLLEIMIASIYKALGDIGKLGFFEKLIQENDEFLGSYFLSDHIELARQGTVSQLLDAAGFYYLIATQPGASSFKCFTAVSNLNHIHVELLERAKVSKNKAEKEELLAADKSIIQQIESAKQNCSHSGLENYPDPNPK